MRILIIEDERPNYDHLVRILEQDRSYSIEGPLTSVKEVRKYFNKCAELPDLILSDIRLTDGIIFEAFAENEMDVPIIFVTAYNEFAIRAFKYNSYDYLLKPVREDALWTAINKFVDRTYKNSSSLSFISNLGKQNYRKRFLCPYKDSMEVIVASDVNHIKIEAGNTRVFTNEGKSFGLDLSLQDLEEQLDPSEFMRVNRQYIVRINSIKGLQSQLFRKTIMRLRGYPEIEISISKENLAAVKRWIDQ